MEKIQVLANFFNTWRKEKKVKKLLNIADSFELSREKLKVETGVKVSSSQLVGFLCDQYLKQELIKRSGKFSSGDISRLKCEFEPHEQSL